MSDLMNALAISSSGLAAQAGRLNIVSQNVANADTPGYRRKLTTFETMVPSFDGNPGVRLGVERLDQSALPMIHDPSHPMANAEGLYQGSNVSLTIEMADAREAQRSYEANLRTFDNARQMTRSLLELLRR